MKNYITLVVSTLLLTITLNSCKERKPAEVITPAAEINNDDSIANAIADSASSTTDPGSQNTTATPQKGACDPAVITLSNPTKNHHIFQVKDFDPDNHKCWEILEKHAFKFCGDNRPCEITYLEISDITKTSSPPYNVGAAVLKKYGIGHFTYINTHWEMKGARIWKRDGKGFAYYNTNI